MSTQEIGYSRPDVFIPSITPETTGDLALDFAAAANKSHGPYDTHEQRVERIVVAGELGAHMVPGAPVLHELGPLDVRAGTLVDYPKVLQDVRGGAFAHVIEYTIQTADGTQQTLHMPFRSLVYGTRKGDQVPTPAIAAGIEGIRGMVAARYYEQREKEALPGGIAWNDISPQTELYRYAALADTGLRLTDILGPESVAEMSGRLQTHLADPRQAHNHPALARGLEAMEHPHQPIVSGVKRVMGWVALNIFPKL